MVEIKLVEGKKMIKEFVEFPLKLYKDNPYFVPPLYADEKAIFTENYVYSKTCLSVFYNAYKDGKMVGRISGIIQKQANEKNNEKRLRFTRFDSIDDQEVATALFNAVEKWGKENGMNTVCGPLGYSDVEREGLLVEGFDELATFEEQYNYEYYGKLIENCGYQKEVDWIESKIYCPKEVNEKIANLAKKSLERHNLKLVKIESTSKLLKEYADDIFACIDECYKHLYGTVDFTDEMKKQMIAQFKLLISHKYIGVIVNEQNKVIAFGLCMPSISKAVQKSGGRLTIPTLIKLLKAIKHPKIIDLALVAILPEYQRTGVSACVIEFLSRLMIDNKIEYCETNLNLESNTQIKSMWKYFDHEQHKRRRSYIKNI